MEPYKKHNISINKNKNPSSNPIQFDYFDFARLSNKRYKYKNTVNHFTRIPNIFIRNSLSDTFGLNRIFLIVYILIDRNRSYENKSYITIGQALSLCQYKKAKRKPKIFYEVIKSLLFLKENYFINCNFDYHTIGYDECIPIEIITENFDVKDNFTKIYAKDFDQIFNSGTKILKESILNVYLYIISFIYNESEDVNTGNRPKAFWRSINQTEKELSMSKNTVNQCIDYLITPSKSSPALLIKREIGNIQFNQSRTPQNAPNIYVLNKEGYEREIELALSKLIKAKK